MGLILSIETATQVCSVAIHREGVCLGELETTEEHAHARQLMLAIQKLLLQVGLAASDLHAVAVSAGPGSYTGLRIGTSVGKGLAYGLDIPLIGVDTLEALAYQAIPYLGGESKEFIVPMIDARRMEVYAAVFDANLHLIQTAQPVILEGWSFHEELKQGMVHFIGDGSWKFQMLISHESACFHKELNSAKSVGVLAYKKFLKNDFVDLAYFEPNYLKEFRVLASKKNPLML
jgi:tRNA threonylcarbamoyladenosine biosynthesis protein TsaB